MSKRKMISLLSEQLTQDESKIYRLNKLKFGADEKKALKILKNAKIRLAQLKFELDMLRG